MSSRVVYTCMFGYSEKFNDYQLDYKTNTDFIIFTDDLDLKSTFWDVRYVNRSLLDPARESKKYKALPHIYLPQYTESVYVDNTVNITSNVDDLFYYLVSDECGCPIFMFDHPWRDCVYEEAQKVINAGYEDPSIVNTQMSLYRSLGYPDHNGLNAATMIIRRHNSSNLNLMMQEWHGQVLRYSKRDQLSFNVVAWLYGLTPGRLPGSLTENDLMKWPFPAGAPRVPRDFDDERYLKLHPDVQRAGLPPRKHYLIYGHREQRRYK